MRANTVIDQGHPWGMLHFRLYGVPAPIGRQLIMVIEVIILVYAHKIWVGRPAQAMMVRAKRVIIWS